MRTDLININTESSLNYGAIITPWGNYSNKVNFSNISTITMPGSFGYLLSLANSIINYLIGMQ